jgi:hypothetical protein
MMDPFRGDDDPESDLTALRNRLREVEIMGLRQMEIIRTKNQHIMLMEQQLADLRKDIKKSGKGVHITEPETA